MSTAPMIPPRPTRHQQAAAAGASKLPEIPPRPARKRLEPSPSRDMSAQSPLNELPGAPNLGRVRSGDVSSSTNLPPRPPSVTLPSIGQEGNEYADLDYGSTEPRETPHEPATSTRNIGGDLPMHAPKPSLPHASAKAQVQAVTRTDSTQATALGFGPSSTHGPEETETSNRSIRSKASFSRPTSSASLEHRRSSGVYDDEQGPVEQGMRVPINPALGEVQAPSPAPGSLHAPNGRRHARTKSGRTIFLPPDSYGLHAHGVQAMDKFDKEWYAKHPDAYAHDESQGHYAGIGSGRGEWAMSSDDLNKIVRGTANRGAGFGTAPAISSYPDEQIGYLASEQYSSRMASPTPPEPGESYLKKWQSNHSQPAVESPLRRTSFPAELYESNKSKASLSGSEHHAQESEADDDVIHVDEPARRRNKVTGGPATIDETEDLGPHGGNTVEEGGWVDEHGYGVPILASDEVAKETGGEHMQPAVSPIRERRGSTLLESDYTTGDHTPGSRPSSRPGSIHGISSLSRFASRNEDREDTHTPLEDVEEYEPLFPDDDGKKKPMTAAERFKQRPGTLRHRFPSQDVWEDTPASALHEATVSTPDLPREEAAAAGPTFETHEDEAARKGEVTEADKATLEPKSARLARSQFAPHLRDDMPTRPGLQQRFPSQDIWEDSPDSVHLVTTVQSPPPEASAAPSPEASSSKPIPPTSRPAGRSKLGEDATPAKQPPVPARPAKRQYQVPPTDVTLTDPTTPTETSPVENKPLVGSRRPKPQVPARPAKKLSADSGPKEDAALEAQQETETLLPATVKAKPSIPARPAGNPKFAAIKAGFLSNLENKLQHGPQGPPKEKETVEEPEPEKDKGPLSDARKGRARGPQRRKPAASPSAGVSAEPAAGSLTPKLSISQPRGLWEISTLGQLTVNEDETREATKTLSTAAKMGGGTALVAADATPRSEKANPLDDAQEPLARQRWAEPSATPSTVPEPASTESGTALNPHHADLTSDEDPGREAEDGKHGWSTSIADEARDELTVRADGKLHAPEEAPTGNVQIEPE